MCNFFSEQYDIPNWQVIGLLFGERGTLTKFNINELLKLLVCLNASTLKENSTQYYKRLSAYYIFINSQVLQYLPVPN